MPTHLKTATIQQQTNQMGFDWLWPRKSFTTELLARWDKLAITKYPLLPLKAELWPAIEPWWLSQCWWWLWLFWFFFILSLDFCIFLKIFRFFGFEDATCHRYISTKIIQIIKSVLISLNIWIWKKQATEVCDQWYKYVGWQTCYGWYYCVNSYDW